MAEKTVDGYIASLADWQAEIVTALRKIILEAAPDAKESIKWAQPVYRKGRTLRLYEGFQKCRQFWLLARG